MQTPSLLRPEIGTTDEEALKNYKLNHWCAVVEVLFSNALARRLPPNVCGLVGLSPAAHRA